MITKPDLGNGVSHPARFNDALIPVFAQALSGCTTVCDPFAGTGKVHDLQAYGYQTIGVEIEPEWALMHPDTHVGNALALPFGDEVFDAIVTSPCYGNRLADSHDARDGSVRRSYTHDLGRKLNDDNAGAMQWGDDYRSFHRAAWAEAFRVLKPGGRLVVNLKDHIRKGKRQLVAGWHVTELCRMGFALLMHTEVVTRGLRQGVNADLRVPVEQVYVLEKEDS